MIQLVRTPGRPPPSLSGPGARREALSPDSKKNFRFRPPPNAGPNQKVSLGNGRSEGRKKERNLDGDSMASALARALLQGAVRGRGGGLRRPPLAEPSALWLRGLAGPGWGGDGEAAAAAAKGRRVRQLLYRSKQRGFLELDILVGEWAQANLADMTMAELDEISGFLDQVRPSPDLPRQRPLARRGGGECGGGGPPRAANDPRRADGRRRPRAGEPGHVPVDHGAEGAAAGGGRHEDVPGAPRPPSSALPRRALAPGSGLTGRRRSRSTPSCGPS